MESTVELLAAREGPVSARPGLGFDLAMRFLQVMGDRLQAARLRLAELHRSVGGRALYGAPLRTRPDAP